MGHIIGRGRYAREVYPTRQIANGGGGGSPSTVVQFSVGTATTESANPIPTGATITDVFVDVEEAYPTDTISVGTTGEPDLLVAPGQFDMAFDIPYDTGQINVAWPGGPVVATVDGSDVVGTCVVRVWYAIPSS